MSKDELFEKFLQQHKEIPDPKHNPKKFKYLFDFFMYKELQKTEKNS